MGGGDTATVPLHHLHTGGPFQLIIPALIQRQEILTGLQPGETPPGNTSPPESHRNPAQTLQQLPHKRGQSSWSSG